MGRIEVNDIKIYAYHGCLHEESVIGGNYLVSVILETDFSAAAESDKLVNTIDYSAVAFIVQDEMKVRSKLIEHVAYRILNRLKTDLKAVESAEVRLTKIAPPIQGDVQNVTVVVKA